MLLQPNLREPKPKSMVLYTTCYSLSVGRMQRTLLSLRSIVSGLSKRYVQLPIARKQPGSPTDILSNRKWMSRASSTHLI